MQILRVDLCVLVGADAIGLRMSRAALKFCTEQSRTS